MRNRTAGVILMPVSFRYLCLCGAAAIAMPAFAETADPAASGDAATVVPEVVVSATGLETDPAKVGSTVTVIGAPEIARKGADGVYEALRGVPGLSFARAGGTGSAASVRLRGADAGHTQVLIDGIEVNDPSGMDNSFDFDGLSTAGVQRIEVLKGPQSALYGSAAMGGVIDIETRPARGPISGSASLEAGSYRTLRGTASVSGGMEKAGLALDGSFLTTGGFSRVADTLEKDGARQRTVHGRFTADPTDWWSVDIAGGLVDQRFDYDDYGADGDDKGKKVLRYGKIDNTVRLFGDRLENVLSLSVADTQRTSDEPLGWVRHATFSGVRSAAEYRANLRVDAEDTATLGVRRQIETVKTVNDGATDVNRVLGMNSVFGQYVFGTGPNLLGWNDQLTVTVGGRYDRHDTFGGHGTYRTAAAYRLGDTGTTLRASLGTGFKAPTAFQLYATTYGNPGLRPETSQGADAGVEQTFLGGKVDTRATLFWNRFRNLIGFNSTANTYANTKRARTRGAELAVTWKPIETLSLTATYTYLDSRDLDSGKTLPRRAPHTRRLGVDWKATEALTVSGDVRLVGSQRDFPDSDTFNAPYTVANAKVSYDVTKTVSVYGRAENLFNASYQEVRGYKEAGRSLYVGVKAGF
jgi:vitamin B12 transporter